MPWTRNPEHPWTDSQGRAWSADDIARSIRGHFGYMSNQGFSRGSIDRRDHARFTPQNATEYCWGENFPIGQYVHELTAGISEHDLSRPEQDALRRAELRFAQTEEAIYLYDPSGLPGPAGAPQNFNFATGEVFLVDSFCQECGWPDTPPLPDYAAQAPVADNEQLPMYTPGPPLAYTPPQQPPMPQPVNANVALHAAGQQQPGNQAPPRRSERLRSRNTSEASTPQYDQQNSSASQQNRHPTAGRGRR